MRRPQPSNGILPMNGYPLRPGRVSSSSSLGVLSNSPWNLTTAAARQSRIASVVSGSWRGSEQRHDATQWSARITTGIESHRTAILDASIRPGFPWGPERGLRPRGSGRPRAPASWRPGTLPDGPPGVRPPRRLEVGIRTSRAGGRQGPVGIEPRRARYGREACRWSGPRVVGTLRSIPRGLVRSPADPAPVRDPWRHARWIGREGTPEEP